MNLSNHYAAPTAASSSPPDPGRVHVLANAIMLGLFASLCAVAPIFFFGMCKYMEGVREILGPLLPLLTVFYWGVAAPLFFVIWAFWKRRLWALYVVRFLWVFSMLSLWPIPFAAYALHALALPHVRRTFRSSRELAGAPS